MVASNFRRQPYMRLFKGQCPVHGEVDSTEVEQFGGALMVRDCKRCSWEALHMASSDSEAHKQAVASHKAERLNGALVGSGITPRFAECTLENYCTDGDQAKAKTLSKCRGYVDRFVANYEAGRSMILSGNVGTGKTHLASAMVQAVIRQHDAVAVIATAAEIIRAAKGAMDRGAGYTERDVFIELAGFDLLVIDEVGAQKGTEYELGVLHEVIDRRYQLVLPTLLVSNLPAPDLDRYIGARALDRLRQNGGQQVGFTWASARGAA